MAEIDVTLSNLVLEDLERGTGTVQVLTSTGTTRTGTKINASGIPLTAATATATGTTDVDAALASLKASTVPLAHVGAGGTAHANATTGAAGFMSSADKTKLDDIQASAINQTTADARYEQTSRKGAANGYAGLDASGKVPTAQLPDLSITDTFVVASEAAMLALTAQVGDVAVRTDINKSFILRVTGASTLGNWQELLTPPDTVSSVAGKTGNVVLVSGDVGAAALAGSSGQDFAAKELYAAGSIQAKEFLAHTIPLMDSTTFEFTYGAGYPLNLARTGPATYPALDGTLKTAGDGVARLGAGLVLEGQGTNLCLYSQGFNAANWTKNNCSVGADAIAAPDETVSADSIARTAAGNHYINQVITVASTASKTYTASIWIKNLSLSGNIVLRLRDGGGAEYGNLSLTPTTSWVRYSVTGSFGAGAAADINLYIDPADDAGAAGDLFYVWGAQVEEAPFSTSYIPTTSAAVTRSPDLCGIVPPHNELIHSNDLTQAAWIKSGLTATKSGADNTLTLAATTDHLYQSVTPASVPSTTRTAAVRIKLGTLSGSVLLRLLDQAGTQIASATINTSDLSASDYRTFIVTGTPGGSVTGLRVQLIGNSGTGTILVRSLGLVKGNNPGVEAQTGDTPIPAPTSPALDPAWQQNGFIEWDSVNPSNVANTTAFYHFGSGITGYPGLYRFQWGTTTKSAVIARRPADGAAEPAAFRDVSGIPDSFYSGARVRSRMEWANYTLNGVRVMSLKLTIDGTLLYSKDVAALLGSTQWTPLTDASTLISGGLANATLSNIVLGYPSLPSGAIPAT